MPLSDASCRTDYGTYGKAGTHRHAFGSQGGKNNCLLINDSYNSDLGSLDIALDFLYRRSQSKGLRRTLILSDILETGQNTPTLYRQVAQLVNSRGIERIIGVGNEISSCAARFNIEKTFYPDTQL